MQKYIFILIAIVALASCGEKQVNTLADKKALLKEKTATLKTLEEEITALQDEISAEEPKSEKSAVTVTTRQLAKEDFNRFLDFQAIVATDDIVNASSDMGGRILKLTVKEGQSVKKGQLIATVDAEGMDKQKDELQKALDLAVDVYERQKRLWDQNIGSEIQFLQAKNNKERIEKSIVTLESNLKKRNVYAPISGAVDQVFLKEGELSGPGTPIVQILNVSKIKVVTDVPETYLGKIKVGDKVQVSFPALGTEMTKSVSQLGRSIDPANRTFKMEVNIDNPKGELKPNLLSIVKVNEFSKKGAIVINIDEIQQEVSGKKFVFIVKDETGKKIAKKAYVTTGENADNKVIITEGLTEGDLIIVKGARSITDGQEVVASNI